MKNLHPVSQKGCPQDTNFLKCFAYEADGRLCLEPATKVDPVRGCYVCSKHANESVKRLSLADAGCLDFLPVVPLQLVMNL